MRIFKQIAAGLALAGLMLTAVAAPAETGAPESLGAPLAKVDAALRAAHKEYVGLRVDPAGAVFLTVSKGMDLDAAAQLARDTWMKATDGADVERLPHFEFSTAAATAEQLGEAYRKMRDVLTVRDVVYLDLDEACGCIAVGIASDSAYQRVSEYIAKRRIFKEWVRILMTPPVMRTLNLRDLYRPTMGGIQIQSRSGTCTLGLPVYSWRRGSYGFLTASHCTDGPQGAMQGGPFHQAGGALFGTDWIGDEVMDMALFNSAADSACPAGRMCRRSDAAYGEYRNPQHYIVGRVMRPTGTCVTSGGTCTLNVARATDDIRMVGGISGLFTGINVDKVGRTSGWTRGSINGTCVDVNISDRDAMNMPVDTGITMLCQTRVATTSLPGDSGSPVFEFSAPSGTGLFAGILWGGSFDGSSMLFSPIDNIDGELGTFVYNQAGVASPFLTNGRFYTSNVDDELSVSYSLNAVPAGEIEIVLCAGPNVMHRKEIVLAEGDAVGGTQWTIATDNIVRDSRNGLYLYQLPGGRLEFRKQIGNGIHEVSRVPIDAIPGGTRITFTWLSD
jgi:hypothetical protein